MTSSENTPSSELCDSSVRSRTIESFGHDVPFVEDDHLVAHALDHFEDVRAVENGLAARRQHAHEVAQHQRRGHIQAGLGFVEEHHRRVVHQRGGNHDLLPHPFRIGGNGLIGGDAQAEQVEEAVDLHRRAAFPAARAGGRPAAGIRDRRETDRGTAPPGCSQARGGTRRRRRGCRGRRTRRARTRARAGRRASGRWWSCPSRSDRGSRQSHRDEARSPRPSRRARRRNASTADARAVRAWRRSVDRPRGAPLGPEAHQHGHHRQSASTSVNATKNSDQVLKNLMPRASGNM